MLFVMEDFSSFLVTAEIPHLNYRLCSPWMNVRYCLYRTDTRSVYDNIKITNIFICGVKLLCCYVERKMMKLWIEVICTNMLKDNSSKLSVVLTCFCSCAEDNYLQAEMSS